MSIPGITVSLRKAAGAANPNDIQRIPMVIGVASRGAQFTPVLLGSAADLDNWGYGPGVELVAETGAVAGWPVAFCRVPVTTAGALSTPVKQAASVSSTSLYGGLLLPGADANGEVFVTAKASGLSIILLNPGMNATLSHTYSGGLITITLGYSMAAIDTTATALAAYINASISTYLSAIAQGTGASLVTAMSETAVANGDLAYLPRQSGVRVRHVAAGNNTALSVSVSTKDVTVVLATDANGTPTSTAALIAAAITASSAAKLLITPTASGTGAGKAGVWGYTSLTYGSTADVSLSGTPVDRYDQIKLECTVAGTVGSSPPPQIRWSLDWGNHWTSAIVPSSGIVALTDSKLISGVTATFTGTMVVEDKWFAKATEPTASITDTLTAMDAAAADTTKSWGFLATPTAMSASNAGSADTKVQGYLQERFCAALLQTRDIASASASEVESDWRTSVEVDFGGFASARGLLAICAGSYEHNSIYTGRQYRRGGIFAAAPRAALTPVHEDLGFAGRGPVANLGENVPAQYLVTGADANGGVVYQGVQLGVSIRHVDPSAASQVLNVTIASVTTTSGTAYEVTVNLATDAGSLVTSTATLVAAAVNAVAPHLLTATVTGTGASVVGSMTSMKAIPAEVIHHDERTQQGLHATRFVTLRSYTERPGGVYITSSPTMADPSETGWTLIEYRDVGLSLARVVKEAAWPHLLESLPGISQAESAVVPKGAIEAVTAGELEGEFGAVANAFLFRKKSDGKVSASPYGLGEKPVTVLRNYSYLASRTLKLEVGWIVLGLNEFISISVTPSVPQ